MWNGLNGLDERAAFKRTTNGYVFRAPSRWLIGPARHYQVDEARKDEIVCALSQIRVQRSHLMIFVVAAALVGLVMSINFRDHLLLAGACGFALLVAFVAVAAFRQLAPLEPLLADLPRTAERITRRDRLAAASAAASFTNLVMLGLIFTAISLASTFQLIGLAAHADGDALPVRLVAHGIAAVSFAGIAAADFVMAYVKLKNRPR
jgi:hypothetical protein